MFLTSPYIDQAWVLKKCVNETALLAEATTLPRFSSLISAKRWLAEEVSSVG